MLMESFPNFSESTKTKQPAKRLSDVASPRDQSTALTVRDSTGNPVCRIFPSSVFFFATCKIKCMFTVLNFFEVNDKIA